MVSIRDARSAPASEIAARVASWMRSSGSRGSAGAPARPERRSPTPITTGTRVGPVMAFLRSALGEADAVSLIRPISGCKSGSGREHSPDVTEAPAPRRRGRPRDADLEDRVFDAVLEVYSETSWRGFTLDAVGRRARVGRAALYRRWSSKDDLLVQALEARSPLPVPIDTG